MGMFDTFKLPNPRPCECGQVVTEVQSKALNDGMSLPVYTIGDEVGYADGDFAVSMESGTIVGYTWCTARSQMCQMCYWRLQIDRNRYVGAYPIKAPTKDGA